MMPPEQGPRPVPATSRVVPYPNESLKLGGGRWLSQDGTVTTELPILECDLTAETLEYWEATAVRSGSTLNDLRLVDVEDASPGEGLRTPKHELQDALLRFLQSPGPKDATGQALAEAVELYIGRGLWERDR